MPIGMTREDMQKVVFGSLKTIEQLENTLRSAQEITSRTRLGMSVTVEMAGPGQRSFDDVAKSRIFDEQMHTVYSKILEARAHLDVARQALELQSDAPKKES